MTYTLNEADRKRLTEFLDKEPWHEIINSMEHPIQQRILYQCSCFEETEDIEGHLSKYNKSFTTPDDRQALCEALMREGKWIEFVEYCGPHLKNYTGDIKAEIRTKGIVRVTRETAAEFYFWLLVEQPERCNYLITKFLEEER
jgi:hypothetical protein